MKHISFLPGQWEHCGLVYAYSWRFPQLPEFRQEEDCIVSCEAPGTPQRYDYMGLLFPEAYGTGNKITLRCSFEGDGAPMLIISPVNEVDEQGVFRTLEYYEIVIWKNGLNVWRLSTENRRVGFYKALGSSFALEAGKIYIISAEIHPHRLIVEIARQKLELYLHDLPEKFHLGMTACEGICRFYDMTVEPKEAGKTDDGAVAALEAD